ncbi:hypothetical protein Bca52824_001480 [Brassica carinata]|uniref:Uncharacterized protein n=1 Tax=Brassica carinata TaxID=52824 RepID=A0A8X7WK82_BRACI|nr:hypothetical protein Bca52824_001480 [Brassica carinata]
MEVYATCLNVLDIDSRFINAMRDNFIVVAPNIQVNKMLGWITVIVLTSTTMYHQISLRKIKLLDKKLYNFDGSKEEESAFVSRLVMQERVIKMMIETSLFPPTKKFNAEASAAKLMELPKCNKHLKIECF